MAIEPKRNERGHVQDTLIDGIKHISVRTSPDGAVTMYARIDEFYAGFPALTADTAEDLAVLLLASADDVRQIEEARRLAAQKAA